MNPLSEAIRGRIQLGLDDLTSLVNRDKSKSDILRLQEILRLLNSEGIEVSDVSDSGNRITLLHRRIRCDATLSYDSEGLLSTLRIIPQVRPVDSDESFYSALQEIEEADISVRNEHRDGKVFSRSMGNGSPAVASLIKLPIAAAACTAAEDGALNLSGNYVVRKDDISVLSSGLDSSCIGRSFTFEDLMLLMLDHSDNSAMDILLRAVPASYLAGFVEVPPAVSALYAALDANQTLVPTTKALYGSAWCVDGSDSDWRERLRLFRWAG